MSAPTSYHDTRDVRSIPTVTASTHGDRYIGSTRDGERVYVEIQVTHHPPQYTTTGDLIRKETVDHRIVTAYEEVTISGITRHPRYGEGSGGQIIDMLGDIDPDTARVDLDTLRALWESAHLNGMNAACIHQDPDAARRAPSGDYDAWKRVAAEETAKCPRGYRYGSKWLVRALTDQERRTARRMIADMMNQPAYPKKP